MALEIDKIVTQLFSGDLSHIKDKGRRNELKEAVRISLNKLANRIDNGVSFDLRVPELPEEVEWEEGTDPKEIEKYENIEALVNSIFESSKDLDYRKLDGDSILNLPEAEPEKKEK